MTSVDWIERRVVLEPRAFVEALGEFTSAIGAPHVVTDPAAIEALGRATVPGARRPSAILYPGSTEEVAQVVKIASRRGVPLWPCSRGRNWGYGSATPFLEGTAILHLERLDHILEVNEELAYAVVEPGVTYRQLQAHLARSHPNLWCDCTDGPPDGSVVGNALERGLGVGPNSDHFGSLCGLEVVLPDGSVIRTGGGEFGRCHTWNTHKWGLGPYVEGLFSQSNFGVVTKAGVWLLRRPEKFVSFTFDLSDDVHLPRLIDAVRELSLRGVLAPGTHIVNDIVGLAVVAQYPRELAGRVSRLPDSVVREMRERFTIPKWGLGGGIQGTRLQVRAFKTELYRALRPLGRVRFITNTQVRALARFEAFTNALRAAPALRKAVGWGFRLITRKSMDLVPVALHVHSVMQGIPSDYFVGHAYFKSSLPKPNHAHPDRDNCGLIWFAPIAPCTGHHVRTILDVCGELFRRHDFDFYAALLMQNSRSIIVLMSIFYNKDDAAETSRSEALYRALAEAMAGAGYQQYRTGTSGMARLFESAPEYAALLRRLKAALDPAGILAPGKVPP